MTGPPAQPSPALRGRVQPAGAARPMSVEAMRAAVIALRAGAFDAPAVPGESRDVVRMGGQLAAWLEAGREHPPVVVLAGHPGAGASTIALALAEALSDARSVQLVEYADRHRSGLATASDRELGVDAVGWRRGRRGGIDLGRPAGDRLPLQLPPPAVDRNGACGDRLLVVDAGWPASASLIRFGNDRWGFGAARTVVVTRMTVPGLRQSEQVLAAVGVPAVVAAVGPRRWPRVVAASCGPAMRSARDAKRMVTVPLDGRLELAGLTPDPLPRAVAAAGRALAGLLLFPDRPIDGPPPAPKARLVERPVVTS